VSGITLVLAGLAAAISGGLARLCFNPRDNQLAFGGVWIGAFALLFFVSWMYVPPWWAKRSIEPTLRQIPAYQLLETHDPGAFAALNSSIKYSTDRMRTAPEIIAEARGQFMGVLRTRMSTASDEALLGMIRVTTSQLQELHKRGDDTCLRSILAARGVVEGTQDYFSKDMLETWGDAFAEVLESSKRAPRKVPPHVDVIPLLTPILEDLKVEYEDELPLLQDPAAASGSDRRRLCEIAIDMNSRLLALPPEQAAKVARYIAANGG
jgi:hypothetical protein